MVSILILLVYGTYVYGKMMLHHLRLWHESEVEFREAMAYKKPAPAEIDG